MGGMADEPPDLRSAHPGLAAEGRDQQAREADGDTRLYSEHHFWCPDTGLALGNGAAGYCSGVPDLALDAA